MTSHPPQVISSSRLHCFVQNTFRTTTFLLLGIIFSFYNLNAMSWAKDDHKKWELTPEIQKTLEAMLDREEPRYDPEARMLASKRTARQDLGHSAVTGTVHDVRTSLFYGVALLDSQNPARKQRGLEVIEKVLTLQDNDPSSRSFGVWPYYAEEPLQKMNFVDYNWADFIGTELAMALVMHPDLFTPQLKEKVKTAMINAAASIQKRNVTVSYTNIAILGTFQTLATAEMFDLPELKKYALDRLKRFYDYTKSEGGFSEYNSSCYTSVSLNALGRMRMVIKDPEARKMIEELYRMEWAEIANHFHPPTRQWSGPQSRSYDTFSSPLYLYMMELGLGGKVQLSPSPRVQYDSFYIAHECPPELLPYFTELKSPREFVYKFITNPVPIIGTTYLTPRLSLGTVNIGDFWNQRRQILAYWGTVAEPNMFRVRVMHDGYDFAAAQFSSAQKEGAVIGGINFAVNGGDTHLHFDKLKEGKFSASELRIRFEFWGPVASQKLTLPEGLDKTYSVVLGDMPFKLNIPYASFGKEKIRWEAGQDEKAKTTFIELVLYSGPKREFKLDDLGQAAVAFALQMDGDPKAQLNAKATLNGNMVEVKMGSLGLEFSAKPDTISALQQVAKSSK